MNSADIDKTAELLAKFDPGFLPYPIFEQIARIVTLPIVEFIPLRLHNGKVEVLLISRDDDDPYWPGSLHTPGTVIRATDGLKATKEWLPFSRIFHDELKDTVVGSPQYVGSIFHESKRGTEQAQLYWVEVIESPKVGSFYSADELPGNLIQSQIVFIKEAVKSFKKENNL